MDVTSITAAIGGLKSAVDIVKSMNEVDRGVEINNKVIELQQVILSLQSNLLQVQSDYAGLVEANSNLKGELSKLKDIANFKEGYELHKVQEGVFVYRNRHGNGDTEHWLCTNCFGNGNPNVLQCYGRNDSGDHYLCPGCDFRMSVGGRFR